MEFIEFLAQLALSMHTALSTLHYGLLWFLLNYFSLYGRTRLLDKNAANYGAVHNDDNLSKQINLPPLHPVRRSEGNYTGLYAAASWA